MNRLYLGDNLQVLQGMPDRSVDIIATDPPFNTGRDWGAFSDKWEGGLKGYLKFMEPRCVEMHRVLKNTGSFYLHCDPTASHYLKVMLDGIFGIKQFRNEIVWHYTITSQCKKKFPNNHDIIFLYGKTSKTNFNPDDIRVPYKQSTINRAKYPTSGIWDNGNAKLNPKGKLPDDVWEFRLAGHSPKENLKYPTQKPIALYERIIKASSNEDDIVLDPFAGSGTTLDAAQTLKRKWIGIDQNPDAVALIEKRLTERHSFMGKDVDYKVVREA